MPLAERAIPGRIEISSYLRRFFHIYASIITPENIWDDMDFSIEFLFVTACEEREASGWHVPELDSITLKDFSYILLTDFEDLFVRGPRGVIRCRLQLPSSTTTPTSPQSPSNTQNPISSTPWPQQPTSPTSPKQTLKRGRDEDELEEERSGIKRMAI